MNAGYEQLFLFHFKYFVIWTTNKGVIMKFENKYNIGDLVWVAFKHHEFNVDNKLPVMEMKVMSFRCDGKFYGEGDECNKVSAWYDLESVGEWSSSCETEGNIHATKEEAEAVATEWLLKSLEVNKANITKIENMLNSKSI